MCCLWRNMRCIISQKVKFFSSYVHYRLTSFRSNPLEVFFLKGFLQMCSKFTRKHQWRSAIAKHLWETAYFYKRTLYFLYPLQWCTCALLSITEKNMVKDLYTQADCQFRTLKKHSPFILFTIYLLKPVCANRLTSTLWAQRQEQCSN